MDRQNALLLELGTTHRSHCIRPTAPFAAEVTRRPFSFWSICKAASAGGGTQQGREHPPQKGGGEEEDRTSHCYHGQTVWIVCGDDGVKLRMPPSISGFCHGRPSIPLSHTKTQKTTEQEGIVSIKKSKQEQTGW